jgi:hypothetical protein
MVDFSSFEANNSRRKLLHKMEVPAMLAKAARCIAALSVLLLTQCGGGSGIQITPNPAVLGPSGTDVTPVQFQATMLTLDGATQDITTTVLWSVADSKSIRISASGLATVRAGVVLPCGFATTVSATQGLASGSATLKLGC